MPALRSTSDPKTKGFDSNARLVCLKGLSYMIRNALISVAVCRQDLIFENCNASVAGGQETSLRAEHSRRRGSLAWIGIDGISGRDRPPRVSRGRL